MIEVRNLTCGYGAKIVLSDVSLTAGTGEFLGIIGPNGSGKTTILRAITRLIRPRTGHILLEGNDLYTLSNREIAQTIAVVSQSLPVVAMTVREFVLLGRMPYYRNFELFERESDRLVVEKAMEMTNVTRLQKNLMSEMSGGEVQLAFIARALAQKPRVLLLDEPTAHLDITHQVRILDLIRSLNKEYGLTVIIILHDLNLASEYCDRLVLMDEGKVKKAGTAHEVLNYEDIEAVYKTMVVVNTNPLSLKPFVLAVTQGMRGRHDSL